VPAAFKLLGSKLAVALAIGGVAVGASAIWVHQAKTSRAPAPAAPVASGKVQEPVSAQLSAALPAEPDQALQLVPDPDSGKQGPGTEQQRKDMLSRRERAAHASARPAAQR